MSRLIPIVCTLLIASGCFERSKAHEREAIATGLLAGAGGKLSADEIRTFSADVRGRWAVAYDPASPPGCTAGGLWGPPKGPPLPAQPCGAYVLVQEKNRWRLVVHGVPGAFTPPDDAPTSLGEKHGADLPFLAY